MSGPLAAGLSRLRAGADARLRRRSDLARLRYLSRNSQQVPGGLLLGPRLELDPIRRDPYAGVGFLRGEDLPADRDGSRAVLRTKLDDQAARRAAATTVAEKVETVPWYHTIELPDGVVTPGFYDHRQLVPHYHLPDDLAGQRVLDVATFNGFWAFELERRGGEVVALDVASSTEYDLPPQVSAAAAAEGIDLEPGAAFKIAAEALGSTVDRRLGNIYTLDPDRWGTYDFVHVGDILLHLERPLEALRRIRSVTTGVLHLSDAFDQNLADRTVRYLGGWSDMEWSIPSLDTLAQMVVDAGFSTVDLLGTYTINSRLGVGGHWRAILQARP